MNFFNKIKAALRRFMQGRTGIDQLGVALIYAVLLLSLLSLIPVLRFLGTVQLFVFLFAMFRIFSRNTAKRYKENYWWVSKLTPATTRVRQATVRLKNRKQYRYFSCPKCHAKLKLPRDVGEVTVTCGKCKHSFRKKA